MRKTVGTKTIDEIMASIDIGRNEPSPEWFTTKQFAEAKKMTVRTAGDKLRELENKGILRPHKCVGESGRTTTYYEKL